MLRQGYAHKNSNFGYVRHKFNRDNRASKQYAPRTSEYQVHRASQQDKPTTSKAGTCTNIRQITSKQVADLSADSSH